MNRWKYNSDLPSLYIFIFWDNLLDYPFSGNQLFCRFIFPGGILFERRLVQFSSFPTVNAPRIKCVHVCGCPEGAGYPGRGDPGRGDPEPRVGVSPAGSAERLRFLGRSSRGRCRAGDGPALLPPCLLQLPDFPATTRCTVLISYDVL